MTAGTNGIPQAQTPPTTLTVRPAGIPRELAERSQWVCWRWELTSRPDKPWTKIPINPGTGAKASTTDPRTWGSLEAALAGIRRQPGIAGVGYVFAADDPFAGVDQDGVRDPETGTVTPQAAALVGRLDSYTEPSISGTGLHTIVRAPLPSGGNRKGNVEAYDRSRFFCFTGRPLPGYDAIQERTAELTAWHAELFPLKPAPKTSPPRAPKVNTVPGTDTDIIECARRWPKFVALFDRGDAGDYPSDSEADLALANLLVRAGADDPEQIVRLLRSSALAREKYDRDDYLTRTAVRALDGGVVRVPEPNRQVAGLPSPSPAPAPQDEQATGGIHARIAALERRVTELERENAQLRAANQKLSLLQSKTTAVVRSKNVGSAKYTGMAVAFEIANQQAANPDRREFVIPQVRIGEQAGFAEETVANHLKELDGLGLWERKVTYVPPCYDRATGTRVEGKNQTVFIPKADPIAILDGLATAPVSAKGPKNGHGGRRICPDCGDVGTVKHWTISCAGCGQVLDQGKEPSPPADETPNRQDAGLVDAAPPPTPAGSPPSVDIHLSAVNGTACHNDAPSPGPAARMSGWLPGLDPPPLDHRTDVRWGGRQ